MGVLFLVMALARRADADTSPGHRPRPVIGHGRAGFGLGLGCRCADANLIAAWTFEPCSSLQYMALLFYASLAQHKPLGLIADAI